MTNNCAVIILLLACVGVCIVSTENIDNNDCPEKCVCRKINENSSLLKVKCGGLPQTKLTTLKDIDFSPIKYDVVQLYVFKLFF